jgi:hypothetical protein
VLREYAQLLEEGSPLAVLPALLGQTELKTTTAIKVRVGCMFSLSMCSGGTSTGLMQYAIMHTPWIVHLATSVMQRSPESVLAQAGVEHLGAFLLISQLVASSQCTLVGSDVTT